MNSINCTDCIHRDLLTSELRRTCMVSFDQIIKSKEPPCQGNDFKKKHEGRVYCADCENHSLKEDEQFKDRCKVVLDVITKVPISCEYSRIGGGSCGFFGRHYKEKEPSNKPETDKTTITRQQAACLCESIDLDSEFFDEDNEKWLLMKMNDPELLETYEALFIMSLYREEKTKND